MYNKILLLFLLYWDDNGDVVHACRIHQAEGGISFEAGACTISIEPGFTLVASYSLTVCHILVARYLTCTCT